MQMEQSKMFVNPRERATLLSQVMTNHYWSKLEKLSPQSTLFIPENHALLNLVAGNHIFVERISTLELETRKCLVILLI